MSSFSSSSSSSSSSSDFQRLDTVAPSSREWIPLKDLSVMWGDSLDQEMILEDFIQLCRFFDELLAEDGIHRNPKTACGRSRELSRKGAKGNDQPSPPKTKTDESGKKLLKIPGTKYWYGTDDDIKATGRDSTFTPALKWLRRPSTWNYNKRKSWGDGDYGTGRRVIRGRVQVMMNNMMILALELDPRRRYLATHDTAVPREWLHYVKLNASGAGPQRCTIENAKALEWMDLQEANGFDRLIVKNMKLLHASVQARKERLAREEQGSKDVEVTLENGIVVTLPGS
ncbi:MAG: hypothetical protein M1828_002258 [Chrysothrix sp. TS-e1954]|nr:MAG: hypothetical protein M1828_002258 [Chrysothrix sp. TS-e1954]